MTLQPQDAFSIPDETIRIARAAYPKGNIYIQMRDALGPIYHDESFAHLFPQNGRPVEAPWRLALITMMQFAEELPDREAADAVRGRIDWKYALGLELIDSGFDASVLCEFRKRLVQREAEQVLLDTMLTLFKERGWLKARGRQRTDSTHVLAKIRAINRLVCVGEAMRFALNSLAVLAPEWLLAHRDDTWLDQYGHRFEEAHLPKGQVERQIIAERIGQDGAHLLADLLAPTAHRGSGRFQQLSGCGKSGSRTICTRMTSCTGEPMRTFPQLPVLLAPRMIRKFGTQKSGIRRG